MSRGWAVALRILTLILLMLSLVLLAGAQESSSGGVSPSHNALTVSPGRTASMARSGENRSPEDQSQALEQRLGTPPVSSWPAPEHRFKLIPPGVRVNAAVRTADAALTCRALSMGSHEDWLPTQRCAPAAALILAAIPAERGLAWWLHRRGHHRLERWSPWISAGVSAAGLAYSMGRRGIR